ncbi:MAG: NfeD family protein [Thermotogae bacterium]|jgi:membrane protein implicated in regulation of membrane protease activity|nr:NfeD family protein [Thermotogota bacterium]MCL5032919.1 NfeD family protein [Thermotogota bacterium]
MELIFWIFLGALMCVTEIFMPTFFLFWFGLGSFAAAITSLFADLMIQIIVFIIVSAILVIFTRPLALKVLQRKDSPRKISIDEIVGERALVIETIDFEKNRGKVKVNGDIWRAVTEDNSTVNINEYVIILKVDGTKLIVRKEEKK